jgi:D-arabinose 1-dehydrogenase-like Zn-dependent alcohol dehydrogenase
MPKMKVAIVPKAKADFEIIERDIPTPGSGEVRIKVQACGICLGDHLVKDGLWPGSAYPRSPGHEISGLSTRSDPASRPGKKGSA